MGMRKISYGMVWVLLCVILLPLTASAEVKASGIEDDGILRVYLKSMNDPIELNITLDGVYTLDGNSDFRFARGAELTLSACGDDIYLSIGGLTQNLGNRLTLKRHADGQGEAGMYIRESVQNNVYQGDLTVMVGKSGLMPILSIEVEKYLYGVVAYEMSDSFPTEALKAQSVAARTYAMRRKQVSEKEYDVVDTTGDQVFRGYTPDVTNVIAAVDATEGVVCAYKGTYATCYFSASNGGQTALPKDIWGYTGDYGYLDMRDDPYDTENPSSMEKTTSIGRDGMGNAALLQMLTDGLTDAVMESGIAYEDLRIKEIVSIEPREPICEGSKTCKKLCFTVKAEAKALGYHASEGDTTASLAEEEALTEGESAALYGIGLLRRWLLGTPYEYGVGEWEELEGEYAIELDVYTDIKDGLNLGLNNMDSEVVSISESETEYGITLRRFGHGVGMSQRGAQWMAKEYGKDYIEILSFYYPNASIERVTWETPDVTELPELAIAEHYVASTPKPLPELRDGEYYATVQVSAGSSLNVRSKPSTEGSILDTLSGGTKVIVSEEAGEGWAHIRTADLDGYVKLEYLSRN